MPLEIRVARVPGRVRTVILEEGNATVREAIRQAEVTDYNGADITVNDNPVDLDATLSAGQTVLIANKTVKGAV